MMGLKWEGLKQAAAAAEWTPETQHKILVASNNDGIHRTVAGNMKALTSGTFNKIEQSGTKSTYIVSYTRTFT